jgi:PBS lyase HEAT-like repeat
LITLMSDPDNSVKIGALLACTYHQYEDPKQIEKTVGKIRILLANADEAVRFQAALACTRLGVHAKPCIPAICSEFVLNCTTSYELRAAGAVALGQVATEDPNLKGPDVLFAQAVSALAHRLSDAAYAVRLASIEALMITGAPKDNTGAAARLLMTTLVERTRYETDEVVKMWVRVCLMRFDKKHISPENINAIGINLKAADDHLQLQAAKALGFMGPVAKSQIPALLECLKAAGERKSLYVLVMCMFALGRMGPDAAIALPEIQKYVDHENSVVKDQAKSSIEQINGVKPKK